jgi:hypothetical protein
MTPEQIIILLLFLLFLILLVLLAIARFLFRRSPFGSRDSVVVYKVDDLIDDCGAVGGILYGPNALAPISLNVEVTRDSDSCNVILSTGQNPNFLQVGPKPLVRAAPILLGLGDSISYQCPKDEAGGKCVFSVKITRI